MTVRGVNAVLHLRVNGVSMQKNFWLHITESRPASRDAFSTYMLAISPAPSNNYGGGAMPTVHGLTWEQLSARLSAVGVHKHELIKAKNELDSDDGSYTIAEVWLIDSQISVAY
jgi:hypothetical protein